MCPGDVEGEGGTHELKLWINHIYRKTPNLSAKKVTMIFLGLSQSFHEC